MSVAVVLILTALGLDLTAALTGIRSRTSWDAWPGDPTWDDWATVRMSFAAASLGVAGAAAIIGLAWGF